MKMADERNINKIGMNEKYKGNSQELQMSTQERLKKEDAHCESPESPHSDYEYSLREENIRLKSRLEQAKEKALLLQKNVTQYKEELQKEKGFSEKANSTIYTLMNEKQSMEDEFNRKHSSGHHKGVEEVVRKLEHEVHLLEDRLERQRKRHHREHLMMYDDLKEERRKQQEWKQTYLRSQVSVMAFRRKLDLMKDKVNRDDRKELMKCLEVGLNDYEDYISERKDDVVHKSSDARHHQPVHEKTSPNHMEKRSSQEQLHTYETSRAIADVNKQHLSNHDKHYPHEKPRSQNTTHEITHRKSPDQENAERHNGSFTHGIVTSNYKEHSPKHSRESPSIDPNQPPKVFIMDDENILHQAKAHNDNRHHSPVHVEIPHHSPSASNYHHNNNGGSSSHTRYELDSNKHHHHHLPSPNTPPLSQHCHMNEGGHTFNHHSSSLSSKERSTHYKHWHHYSVDNPGHSRGALNRTDQRYDDNIKNGHTSSSVYHRDDAKYQYKTKFIDYSKDQLELNVNDTKFLELKFDHSFLKNDSHGGSHKMISPNEVMSGKSVIPPGTPLEHKKVWCLTCDGEVTKKPCGHSSLVIQIREKEFPCPTCHRIFNNRSHLKRHNMIHSGEKPWGCTYCEKRFNRKSHLNRHLLTHTGERPFKCPYCAKGFADNSDLKRHKQIHETTPGFIPIRPKETVSPSATTAILVSTTHIVTPHQPAVNAVLSSTQLPETGGDSSFIKTGENSFVKKKSEPRFPCSKCGKVFTRKSHLTRHKLTHDQVKIYCDCGRMFRQNAHLQAHLPACKRKREVIEQKYLAGKGTVIKEERPPSPMDSEKTPGEDTDEKNEAGNNNNEGEYKEHETSSSPNKLDVDLSFNYTSLPPGIPPLIRDPA